MVQQGSSRAPQRAQRVATHSIPARQVPPAQHDWRASPQGEQLPPRHAKPDEHVSPAQHGCSAPPQGEHCVSIPRASQRPTSQLVPPQHGRPTTPHSQRSRAVLHRRLGPQREPSQQGVSRAPHATQSPPRQSAPAAQVVPPQQGVPTMPHTFRQVPPEHESPAAQVVPPQHGWASVPQSPRQSPAAQKPALQVVPLQQRRPGVPQPQVPPRQSRSGAHTPPVQHSCPEPPQAVQVIRSQMVPGPHTPPSQQACPTAPQRQSCSEATHKRLPPQTVRSPRRSGQQVRSRTPQALQKPASQILKGMHTSGAQHGWSVAPQGGGATSGSAGTSWVSPPSASEPSGEASSPPRSVTITLMSVGASAEVASAPVLSNAATSMAAESGGGGSATTSNPPVSGAASMTAPSGASVPPPSKGSSGTSVGPASEGSTGGSRVSSAAPRSSPSDAGTSAIPSGARSPGASSAAPSTIAPSATTSIAASRRRIPVTMAVPPPHPPTEATKPSRMVRRKRQTTPRKTPRARKSDPRLTALLDPQWGGEHNIPTHNRAPGRRGYGLGARWGRVERSSEGLTVPGEASPAGIASVGMGGSTIRKTTLRLVPRPCTVVLVVMGLLSP